MFLQAEIFPKAFPRIISFIFNEFQEVRKVDVLCLM